MARRCRQRVIPLLHMRAPTGESRNKNSASRKGTRGGGCGDACQGCNFFESGGGQNELRERHTMGVLW